MTLFLSATDENHILSAPPSPIILGFFQSSYLGVLGGLSRQGFPQQGFIFKFP
jgi:hypothetical protein